MRVSTAVAHWFGAGVVLLVLSERSALATEASAYELAYAAGAACPDREAFQAMVRTQLAESNELSAAAAPHVDVRIEQNQAGFSGRFELEWEDRTSVRRELTATTCSEVAPALAFVLALALGKRQSDEEQETQHAPAIAEPRPPSRSRSAVAVERAPAQRIAASALGYWSRRGAGDALGSGTDLDVRGDRLARSLRARYTS
jgi:hypothetical protein